MRTVYVSIGNSDDKLSQSKWASFLTDVESLLEFECYEMHGAWFSAPDRVYQNACWCIVMTDEDIPWAQTRLRRLAATYRQDSITWAEIEEVEFLEPEA